VAFRLFIDKSMRSGFGDNWMKQHVPPEMYDQWHEKRDKEVAAGREERPLIEFADFSDYRVIIERRDNWNAVFKPVFGRIEFVRESLQRLQPLRIPMAHSRLSLTLDDEVFLIVEIKHLMKAILRYLG
jgi:hypothetical protein